ncbi:hypothetical protein [Halomarina rubra]|uniref:Uncharacterized protein n=1 Tax=Halomarina rubra TaxID=2071873 RepID=A0ABD6AVT5_9EURY|nr:hypothetical protein [Halomarina rubra]
MSDRPEDDTLDSIDDGLDALVLVDVARELVDAVDFEALQNGAAYAEAVDQTQLRRTLGGPVGRVVARRLADRVVGSGVTGLVGREVAGRAGASLVEYLVEQVDPETILASLEAMAEESADESAVPADGGTDDPTVVDVTPDDAE